MHACLSMKGWGRLCRAAALSCAAGVSLAIGACDPQASPEFRGLSLLTVHGSVTIAEGHTQGELVPALAFANQDTGEIEIVDVEVQGEFPSDFRLDVFEPPSGGALRRLTDFGPHEPRLALGYITAVTRDHPGSFFYATNESSEIRASGCDGCELECDPVRGCATTQQWCSDEAGTHCYSETTICPAPDSPPEQCRIEADGDPTLKEPAWRFFSGFSQNYAVAYLADPAADGCGTAAILGADEGLKAGYHLLGVREFSGAAEAEAEACASRADQLGIDRYNRAHDTHYGVEELDVGACITAPVCAGAAPECRQPVMADHPSCALSEQAKDALLEALRVEGLRARVDLDCALSPFSPITTPADAAISIRISSDAQPGF
jgi:hypothetical protein